MARVGPQGQKKLYDETCDLELHKAEADMRRTFSSK